MSASVGLTPDTKEVAEALIAKLELGGPDGTCWENTGSLRGGGYGRLKVAGRAYATHRIAWVLVNGQIPSDLMIDHLCRNRKCANVKHLRLVTHAANVLENSESIVAINVTKTHCLRGHEFTPENTQLVLKPERPSGGYRRCRACGNIRQKSYYAAKRAKL